MVWLAVHTRPRQEETAAEHLRRQGYRVFYPRLRQRKRRDTRWQWVTGPLFPRYLFIEVDIGVTSTSGVRSTRGVVDFVRFGHELVPVDEAIIAYLQARQDPELAAESDETWPHKPGDRVEITAGPFAGLSGIYQVENDAERVTLLIELLGRQSGVVVARDSLGESL